MQQQQFKVGDKVTWRNAHYATLSHVNGRKRFGDGPFTVLKVIEVQEQDYLNDVGAAQWLVVQGCENGCEWSGAFFKLAS